AAQVLGLLSGDPPGERGCRGQLCVARVSNQAQVRHERRGEREPRMRQPQHLNLQRVSALASSRSGYRLVKSSPGQTTTEPACTVPRVVWTRGASIAWTFVLRMKVTPCLAVSHAARRGIAVRDSTRSSTLLSRTASAGAPSCGQRRRA